MYLYARLIYGKFRILMDIRLFLVMMLSHDFVLIICVNKIVDMLISCPSNFLFLLNQFFIFLSDEILFCFEFFCVYTFFESKKIIIFKRCYLTSICNIIILINYFFLLIFIQSINH